MKQKLLLSIFSLALFFAGSMNVLGQETAHFVPGVAGIKGGTLPPPGFYYIMHNVYYTADTYNDGNGDALDNDFELDVFANVHRFVYIWEDVMFGANYAINMLVPLNNTDISIGAAGLSDSQFGLGDIVFEPFVLSWNEKKYDIALGLAAIMPTGKMELDEIASPGKGFWTGMLTLGGTYYFDAKKSLHASLVTRYEVHSEKKDLDLTPGNDFTFEWGVGKTIPAKAIWSFGVSGYGHWQLSEDQGDDVWYDAGIKDQIFAAGPEVDCFIPPLKLNVELRGQFEFSAVDRPQGSKFCLSLFKSL